MNDDEIIRYGLLGAMPQQRGLLDGLQLTGGGGTFRNGDVTGANIGGRIGYEFPLNHDSSLALGASGGGYRYKADTPDGVFRGKDFAFNGLDANYRNGPNQFSAEYGMGPDPRLMLRYMREF
ncbi:MAG: hypothetical protein Q8K12_14075 [Thiobacillus sp.]|nr:hypothetical protein [Thiobacillus sp.]